MDANKHGIRRHVLVLDSIKTGSGILMVITSRTRGRNCFNTLRPGQNGRHFPDEIFKCVFLNENVWITTKISLKFVPKGPIDNTPALVQLMAWRRPDAKPLSEPMMLSLRTHICVTRPHWANITGLPHAELWCFLCCQPGVSCWAKI